MRAATGVMGVMGAMGAMGAMGFPIEVSKAGAFQEYRRDPKPFRKITQNFRTKPPHGITHSPGRIDLLSMVSGVRNSLGRLHGLAL